MTYKTVSRLITTCAAVVLFAPVATFAATSAGTHAATKQVSQDFGTSFNYFAQSTGGAVFSDGSFYRSSKPQAAVDWKKMSVDADRSDEFTPVVAVAFKKNNYVISGSTTSDDASADVAPTEILRIKRTSADSLSTVFTMPDPTGDELNHLYDIEPFRGALYASDSEGRVWKSRNGTSWKALSVAGLGDGTALMNLIATTDMLYGVSATTLFGSSNGKTWEQAASELDEYTYGGTVGVAEFSGKTYLYTYSTSDYTGRVWRLKKNGSLKSVFTSTTDNHYGLHAGMTALYLIEYDDAEDQYVVRTLGDGAFSTQYTGDGFVRGVVDVSGNTLFVVLEDGVTYLLRYTE